MTDRARVLDLISQLEAAPSGSRELDVRIYILLNPSKETLLDPGSLGPSKRAAVYGRLTDIPIDGWGDYEGLARHIDAPYLTTSLDVAMTLKPAGADCWGLAHTPEGTVFYWSRGHAAEDLWYAEGRHKTSDPIAACIAALRAEIR